MRKSVIVSMAAALTVAAGGAGVAANAQPSPTKLQLAEAHAIDVMNAQYHLARRPSATPEALRSADAIEKRLFASGSKSKALAILAEAPAVEQALVAWDVAHSLDGVTGTAQVMSPTSLRQYPPPDPNTAPQPVDPSNDPTPPPPDLHPQVSSDPACWKSALQVTFNKNGYGQHQMVYEHRVVWCQVLGNPALIRFDADHGGLGAMITSCFQDWFYTCTVDATQTTATHNGVTSSLPVAGDNEWPSVTTVVAASFGINFSISLGPIGHDFAVVVRAGSTVELFPDHGTGTCHGPVGCHWVPPNF